jgi:hypothetical protein
MPDFAMVHKVMMGLPSGIYRIWSSIYQKQPRGEPHLDSCLEELIAAQTASRI